MRNARKQAAQRHPTIEIEKAGMNLTDSMKEQYFTAWKQCSVGRRMYPGR